MRLVFIEKYILQENQNILINNAAGDFLPEKKKHKLNENKIKSCINLSDTISRQCAVLYIYIYMFRKAAPSR